jgi:hypothetical protein
MDNTSRWTAISLLLLTAACGGDKDTSDPDLGADIPDRGNPYGDTGTGGTTNVPVDSDGDGYTGAEGDCDDSDPTLFPFDRTATGGDVGCGYRVAAGESFFCALDSAGGLSCEGSNDAGQTNAPAGTFVAVNAGSSHVCAREASGALTCWGYDTYGQASPPDASFQQVDAGGYLSCGITTEGAVSCFGGYTSGSTPSPEGTFTQVSAGSYHACGVLEDTTITCWSSDELIAFGAPPSDRGFVAVDVGQTEFACGLTSAGGVTCWGTDTASLPELPTSGVSALTVGGYGTLCMLDDTGALACVGTRELNEAGPFQQVNMEGREVCTVDSAGAVDCR